MGKSALCSGGAARLAQNGLIFIGRFLPFFRLYETCCPIQPNFQKIRTGINCCLMTIGGLGVSLQAEKDMSSISEKIRV